MTATKVIVQEMTVIAQGIIVMMRMTVIVQETTVKTTIGLNHETKVTTVATMITILTMAQKMKRMTKTMTNQEMTEEQVSVSEVTEWNRGEATSISTIILMLVYKYTL